MWITAFLSDTGEKEKQPQQDRTKTCQNKEILVKPQKGQLRSSMGEREWQSPYAMQMLREARQKGEIEAICSFGFSWNRRWLSFLPYIKLSSGTPEQKQFNTDCLQLCLFDSPFSTNASWETSPFPKKVSLETTAIT